MAKPVKLKTRKKHSGSWWSLKLWGAGQRFLLLLLPYLLSVLLVTALFGGVVAYAMHSPTFELAEVKVLNVGTLTPQAAFDFCELKKGENLIALDLVSVQQVIKRKHPEFKEVKVRRVLPNRIEVTLKRRTPILQVAFSRYVQIDKDLVILPGSSPAPFKNLTVIEGAPLPKEGLYVGVTIRDAVTKKAIKLSEIIKESQILRKHTLSKIDIGDPKNIVVIVDEDIEIRIGGDHFMERLKILGQTLKTVELDRTKIRYVDLRFDDVVIGPR
jgi:cell division septal protein FtsQ